MVLLEFEMCPSCCNYLPIVVGKKPSWTPQHCPNSPREYAKTIKVMNKGYIKFSFSTQHYIFSLKVLKIYNLAPPVVTSKDLWPPKMLRD